MKFETKIGGEWKMKRKKLAVAELLLSSSVLMFSAVGCGKTETDDNAPAKTTQTEMPGEENGEQKEPGMPGGEDGEPSGEGPGGGEGGPMGEGPGGEEGGLMGPGPGGAETAQPRPEMAGELVYKFGISKEISDSLGKTSTLGATVELYDTENADGYTALLGVVTGGNYMYTPATWTEEAEGNFQLPIDEFTTYKTMEIDGVTTFTGIRYAFGMNKGTVDIPMAGLTDQFGTETGPDVGGQEVEIENKK